MAKDGQMGRSSSVFAFSLFGGIERSKALILQR
jgi:hypothetical protein